MSLPLSVGVPVLLNALPSFIKYARTFAHTHTHTLHTNKQGQAHAMHSRREKMSAGF